LRNAITLLGYIHNWPIEPPSKHLVKNRLRELVEFRQGFPALGSEGIGLVEDGGDAALFGEGWKVYGSDSR
jgi:hypothetical protein